MRVSASFRWQAAIAGAWLLSGVALGFFDRALWDHLWMAALSVWVLYTVVGASLWLLILWHIRKTPRSSSGVNLALALPLGAIVLWLVLPQLARAGDQFLFTRRFASLRAQYATLVAEVQRGAPSPRTWAEQEGIRFQVDPGPPVRVAFLQPGGILDNWEGVIYDPTGRVRRATGWRNGIPGNYTASPDLVNLFGGALLACVPIEDAYYRCWFT